MIKKHILTARAAEFSVAKPSIDLNVLARMAGLPFDTRLQPCLASEYGVEPETPLGDRLDLYDLVWVTTCVLNDLWPSHRRKIHPFRVHYHFEVITYRNNPANPACVAVVAEVHTHREPGHLYLRLPAPCK